MPRAKRIDPVSEDEPDEQLDQAQETDTLTGAIPEGVREVLRPIVSKMGWAPKEEWKRDPAEWRDELQFLEQTPEVIAKLKESGDRQARAAAAAIEEERARKAEEAQRIIRESDDPDKREAAAKELRGPPPQTVAWMARNPWFDTDPDAKALAVSAVMRAEQGGADIPTALAAGEEAVRKRFPEYFSAGTEQRLSDVRRQAPTPPQVQEGSRATPSQPKERGWAEIPRADREAFERHLLKAYVSRGKTKEQAQAMYADGYWKEGVIPPNEREEDPWVREKKSNPWVTRGRG